MITSVVLMASCLLTISVAWIEAGCGGGSDADTTTTTTDTTSSVTATLAPSSTSGLSLVTSVNATFSDTILNPLSWAGILTLQKDGAGSNLCTSAAYNNSVRRVSCAHDTLDANASYTVTLTGAKDSDGNAIAPTSLTFTTTGASPISPATPTTKASITPTSAGATNTTFNFGSALASGLTPVVTISSSSDVTVEAGTCTLNADRTACTTAFSDLTGCETPTDYLVTLSMSGYDDYSFIFNSADNEFDDADNNPLTNTCWEDFQTGSAGDYVWTTSNGNLHLIANNVAGTRQIYFEQPFTDDKTGAFTVHLVSMGTLPTDPQSGENKFAGVMAEGLNTNGIDIDTINSVNFGIIGGTTDYTGLFTSYIASRGDEPLHTLPTASGDLSAYRGKVSDVYICMTAYNGILTSYVSDDGVNFIKLTDDNMQCATEGVDCQLSAIDSRSTATWNNLRLSIWVQSDMSSGDNSFEAQFGFARFRTENLNGSMADCPHL